MGTISVGAGITMSGILLAQVEESDDDLQLSKEQGSWFGMRLNIQIKIITSTTKYLIWRRTCCVFPYCIFILLYFNFS